MANKKRKRGKSSRRRNNPWPLVGVLGAIVIIAAFVAFTGGSSDTGLSETAAVSMSGAALPPTPDPGQADQAAGLTMPEATGISFDGTPVEISNDGRAKIIFLLAHW
jgi:hypothetical protein